MTNAAPVNAWSCLSRGSARCGGETIGKAPKKCRACGGQVYSRAVIITVQQWRGDGRYTLESAVSTWRVLAAAERAAAKGDGTVVRFVFA